MEKKDKHKIDAARNQRNYVKTNSEVQKRDFEIELELHVRKLVFAAEM